MRSSFYIVVLIALVWSLRTIEIIPEFLYDAPQQTADLFARMWPIDWAWYPKVVHVALIETLHTATLGTVLAVAMAALVALMVARNVTRSVVLNAIGRFILVATRSVHAMVWALFFVAVFGPGALAGTLAIAVHSIGFTGKFLSEAIEEAKPGPKTATKNSAQTSVWIDRVATRMKRPMALRTGERVTLRATMSAVRLASATARMVPSVAVCSVSMSAGCTTFGYQDQSIGHMRANRSAVCAGAS